MNICFVIESFYPEINGGAVHTRLLAEKFHEAGNKVMVVTQRRLAKYPRREIVSGFPVIRVGPTIRFGMLGRYLCMLTILLPLMANRRGYDVALVAAPRILGAPVIVLMKLLGKKCVIKPDSCGEMDGSYALQQLSSGSMASILAGTYFRIRNFFLKRADAYIAISSVIFRELHGMGIASDRIATIPNGVDSDRFAPPDAATKLLIRKRLGLPDEAIIFAYCGRLTREKGLGSLIRVWKQLRDRYRDIHLLLIGSGKGLSLDCEDELRSFVSRENLDSSVCFTGAVEDVRDYLKSADIFVLPSRTEALGVALIEALLIGIPAIATRVDGIPDVITQNVNGLLVKPDNDAELLDAASTLIDNQANRDRLTSAARKSAIVRFSITQVVQKYLDLLNAVLDGKQVTGI